MTRQQRRASSMCWAPRSCRTPAREAIAHLVAVGLLRKDPNRSACVVGPSLTAIMEAYVIRQQLEPFAAEITADARVFDDAEQRAELDRLHEMMATSERSSEVWDQAHQDFHMLLVSGSGIGRLQRLIQDLRTESRAYINVVLLDDQFARRAHRDHDQMRQLAIDGDGKALNSLLRRHLARTIEQISRAVAAEQMLRSYATPHSS
jgi:DNA-binding GntR family transcriptional regulator